jgi:hypothetical protein
MTLLLVPTCFSSGMEAPAYGARQDAGPGGVEAGRPPSAFSHLRESILFRITKEKKLFSWLAEKIIMARLSHEKWQEVT